MKRGKGRILSQEKDHFFIGNWILFHIRRIMTGHSNASLPDAADMGFKGADSGDCRPFAFSVSLYRYALRGRLLPADMLCREAGNVSLKIFYGWAVVTTEEASSNQRQVIASPLPTNPYHADIVLPSLAAEDREEQKRHAQELADASRWRDRPNSREE